MNQLVYKIPLPMAGLMLALATMGNLVVSYGEIYRNFFGLISAILLILMVLKIAIYPTSIVEGFENPVVASVMPTFSMGIIVLSGYLKVYFATAAQILWFVGIIIHIMLMLFFTKKYILSFDMKKVFPSYFVVYVGIVVGSVTAPAFGFTNLGQYIFWFGLISYLVLLPMVMYRVFKYRPIPEPVLPTLVIFAAPASLCMVGYLQSFQEKSLGIIAFLAFLIFTMLLSVFSYMPKLLKLPFFPSFSAFTFPFVISAVAIKGLNNYLINIDKGIGFLIYVTKFMELWSVLIVLYVMVRYIGFLLPSSQIPPIYKASKTVK